MKTSSLPDTRREPCNPGGAEIVLTERLKLRGPRMSDLATFHAMVNDPSFLHFGFKPLSEEDVFKRLLIRIGHWGHFGYGMWMLEDIVTGSWLGEAGFLFPKREGIPLDPEVPEVGWALVNGARGKGLAGEAMAAVLTWGEEFFGHQKAQAIIHPDNQQSNRLAQKLGLKPGRAVRYNDSPVVIWDRQ